MDITALTIIRLFVILFVLFLLSMFEVSLYYVRIVKIGIFNEENEDDKKRMEKYLEQISSYISTTYFCKIIMIIFYCQQMKKIFDIHIKDFFSPTVYFFVSILLISLFYFLIIECIAKIIGKKDIYKTLKNLLGFINILRIFSYPVVLISKLIVNMTKTITGFTEDIDNLELTEEYIKASISTDDKGGTIEEEEKEMINSIFEFTDTTVGEILTPRTSVFALEYRDNILDQWDEIMEKGFSRIPIYKESIDNIIGMLYIKDILKYINKKEKIEKLKIKDLMKPAYFIPETKKLSQTLEEFRKKRNHMAIIVDEYGGTLGIITIEDLLEEIVGEIRDEYDVEEENILSIKNNIFDVRGDTTIDEINDEIKINIPLSEDYETIAGFLLYRLGKIAEVNDRVVEDGFIIEIVEVENKRIEKVKIIIQNDNDNKKV